MEHIIKKNFKLSSEKKSKFTEGNPVQITLREQLEEVYKEKNQLEDRIQGLNNLLIKPDYKDWADINNVVAELKKNLALKQKEIINNENVIKNMDNHH